MRTPRFRLSVALTGAVVGLLCAELGVRALAALELLPPDPAWLDAEYAVKAETMEGLSRGGGAGLVVLGSSVADTGIDPALLSPAVVGDRPAYNAGLLGPTPTIVADWSAGWVEPLLAPDTAVIVISSRDVNRNAPHLGELERRWAAGPRVRERLGAEGLAERAERWLTDRSALLRYRSVLRRPIASVLRAAPPPLTPDGQDTHLLDEGYRIELFVDDLLAPGSTANAWRDFELDGERLAALHGLVERLVERGVRVLLVDAPVTIDYPPLHTRGADDYRRYRDRLTRLAEDTGAELLVPGLWPLDLFADPVHVNGDGARRLTALVDAVLRAPTTTGGGLVDTTAIAGVSALLGPPDPADPDVPGPATIPASGLGLEDTPGPVEAGTSPGGPARPPGRRVAEPALPQPEDPLPRIPREPLGPDGVEVTEGVEERTPDGIDAPDADRPDRPPVDGGVPRPSPDVPLPEGEGERRRSDGERGIGDLDVEEPTGRDGPDLGQDPVRLP